MASFGSQRVDKNTPIMVLRRRGKTTRGAGNFSGGDGKLRGSEQLCLHELNFKQVVVYFSARVAKP